MEYVEDLNLSPTQRLGKKSGFSKVSTRGSIRMKGLSGFLA
jgi:hypothetical protein